MSNDKSLFAFQFLAIARQQCSLDDLVFKKSIFCLGGEEKTCFLECPSCQFWPCTLNSIRTLRAMSHKEKQIHTHTQSVRMRATAYVFFF